MDHTQKPEFYVPSEKNELLAQILEDVNNNVELKTFWKIANINAIEKLGMSDHGSTHFQIVANSALKILRLLADAKVELSLHKYHGLSQDYSEVVVFLGSILHDIGMSIHRDGHEEFSLFLAHSMMQRMLAFMPAEERTIVIAETLHVIIAHRSGGRPLTIEAGVLRFADALDMTKGRSRIPYEAGNVNIHSVSALAIDEIEISKGENLPIHINIVMNNSAGIFQIDDLLHTKLTGSGIENYVSVRAYNKEKVEKSLITEFVFSK